MKLIRHNQPDFSEQVARMTAASSLFDKTIEERTRAIIEAVEARGDAALVEFTQRFDGAQLTPEQFAVGTAELLRGCAGRWRQPHATSSSLASDRCAKPGAP